MFLFKICTKIKTQIRHLSSDFRCRILKRKIYVPGLDLCPDSPAGRDVEAAGPHRESGRRAPEGAVATVGVVRVEWRVVGTDAGGA